ncbi:MAG: hypothetical protein WC934_15280 [Acidithiobacillus sp.]|uniref:hypothetical protein n=1 Tax=Acidithiobacillus sp. TaxID=1872118 RepID=UPI0035606354
MKNDINNFTGIENATHSIIENILDSDFNNFNFDFIKSDLNNSIQLSKAEKIIRKVLSSNID